MSDAKTDVPRSQTSPFAVVAGIVVVGIFLLSLLYLGVTRYYNAQEVRALVDGATAAGQSYSVEIHNPLTGRYSFNTE